MNAINGICLAIWISLAAMGVIFCFKGYKVNPITFICAAIICIMHYIEKLCG